MLKKVSYILILSHFLYIFTFATIFDMPEWTPTNVRGYLYYPNFGPYDYNSKKLELIFDFDRFVIPYESLSDTECCGCKNSTRDCQRNCTNADWYENKTIVVKPYKRI